MKLRRIRLGNVRRFVAPVQIDAIADGLNVLSAPNERGKSTLFDAVHALFFAPYRSRAQSITALQPHPGGAPEVAVEVETAQGLFLIEKRWLSRPQARVSQGARLVAQADDAEAWIANLLGGDAGPTGLLWVRQGFAALDPRDGSAIEARRDLLSSVAGEVEAMTGGRRMDAALRRCREELARYQTAKGRARADGPLVAAQKEVDGLIKRQAALADQVAVLVEALARRREVRRQLVDLRDPEAAAARQARLSEAIAALAVAERHAELLRQAADAANLAQLRLEGVGKALERLRATQAELAVATTLVEDAALARAAAEAAQAEAHADLAAREAAHDAASRAAEEARRILHAALRQEAAEDSRRRRAELVQRIAQAEAVRAALEEASARAASGPTPAESSNLEGLAQAVVTARRLRDAAAVQVSMAHTPGGEGGAVLNGVPLEEGRAVAITAPAVLALRGLGELSIRPGRIGEGDEEVSRAEAALAAALERLGQPDRAGAQAAAQARQAAEGEVELALAQLRILAPEGLDVLRAALIAIPDIAEDASLPDSNAAQAAQAVAEAEQQAQAAAREAARARLAACSEKAARAAAAEEGARERLQRARAAAGEGEPGARAADLAAELAPLAAAHAEAESRRAALASQAPDLIAARAARDRAQSVVDAARTESGNLEAELARLDTLIDLRASEAVEEELADTEARLEAAREQLGRVQFEVALLRRLESALDTARTEARERYFAPVMAELAPLLRLLWPEATLRFDDATLLPSTLIREGQEEGLNILSGGTQEQIALLVRLAFARMHARAGRASPLILDDALVFTDDDRIEAMFDALHRQAADIQIIVLTCRQRAFRDLGGHRLTFSPMTGSP